MEKIGKVRVYTLEEAFKESIFSCVSKEFSKYLCGVWFDYQKSEKSEVYKESLDYDPYDKILSIMWTWENDDDEQKKPYESFEDMTDWESPFIHVPGFLCDLAEYYREHFGKKYEFDKCPEVHFIKRYPEM